jgi:HlyD family secretion protein
MTPTLLRNKSLLLAAGVLLAGASGYVWLRYGHSGPGPGFVGSNGRIEATDIDVATKYPGRVAEILAAEGDFVTAGQVLATMQIDVLQAQSAEARAGQRQAQNAAGAAEAQVALREAEALAADAQVQLRRAELDAARRRLARSESLAQEGAAAQQELDDDRARVRGAEAALAAATAQTAAGRAAVNAARAQLVGAQSSVDAAAATVARIDADISDATLRAPRDGRVQFRVAQPGEVLAGGGRVLNLVDLSDVYMTFFLPETTAGKVAIGSEVRLVLDAAPQYVIPAKVSFVASTAQFTPKSVETASERQKLMFRVRAQIAPELLREHLAQVKTGVPGMAWIRVDGTQPWPDSLAVRLPATATRR